MAAYIKTLKTATTTGYVLPLPTGGCSELQMFAESGEFWVEPMINQTNTPGDPTNALVCGTAGVDNAKNTIHMVADKSRKLNLADGYSADNVAQRFTHIRVWSVGAGIIEFQGS